MPFKWSYEFLLFLVSYLCTGDSKMTKCDEKGVSGRWRIVERDLVLIYEGVVFWEAVGESPLSCMIGFSKATQEH